MGSVLRYWVGMLVARQGISSFPFGTLTVNIIGCFLIGLIAGVSERTSLVSPEVRLLLATGFCGGFTTFSAFSQESLGLMQNGEFVYLAANIFLSVFIGIACTYLGLLLGKAV